MLQSIVYYKLTTELSTATHKALYLMALRHLGPRQNSDLYKLIYTTKPKMNFDMSLFEIRKFNIH